MNYKKKCPPFIRLLLDGLALMFNYSGLMENFSPPVINDSDAIRNDWNTVAADYNLTIKKIAGDINDGNKTSNQKI